MTLFPYCPLNPSDLPVPQDRPFTTRQALDCGVTLRQLRDWRTAGLIVTPVRGVHHVASLLDTLELRVACLSLIVPRNAVVTDRIAAWLLGAPMVLAPGDHLVVPPVTAFCPPGNRLRNELVLSGERMLADTDVMEIGGVLVTTPLRTACDLGRLLHRDQAYAALCMMLRLGEFTVGELVDAMERFAGFRGVRQGRELAPEADPRVQSPGEAALLRRWKDCSELLQPDLQIEVQGPDGLCYLDMGLPDLRYAAEYDGAEWHGEEQRAHDRRRRTWIKRTDDWMFDVFKAEHVFGGKQNAEVRLREGVRRARERRPRWL